MDTDAQVIERYFGTWNEPDAARRQELAASVFSPQGRYVDPLADVRGPAGFAGMVGSVQEQFAGHTFRLASGIERHHDRLRFAWDMVAADGSVAVTGIDVAHVDEDGRLADVTGFFGRDIEVAS